MTDNNTRYPPPFFWNDSLRVKFPKRRQTLCTLAIRHLQDKSSSVRKFVVRVLTKLLSTHPYDMYGGELGLEEWQDRLDKLNAELEVYLKEKKKNFKK